MGSAEPLPAGVVSLMSWFTENSARHPLLKSRPPEADRFPWRDEGVRFLRNLHQPFYHSCFRAEYGGQDPTKALLSLQIPTHEDQIAEKLVSLGAKLTDLERQLERPRLIYKGFDARDPTVHFDHEHPGPPVLYVRREDVTGPLPRVGDIGDFTITAVTPYRCSDTDERDYGVRFEMKTSPKCIDSDRILGPENYMDGPSNLIFRSE